MIVQNWSVCRQHKGLNGLVRTLSLKGNRADLSKSSLPPLISPQEAPCLKQPQFIQSLVPGGPSLPPQATLSYGISSQPLCYFKAFPRQPRNRSKINSVSSALSFRSKLFKLSQNEGASLQIKDRVLENVFGNQFPVKSIAYYIFKKFGFGRQRSIRKERQKARRMLGKLEGEAKSQNQSRMTLQIKNDPLSQST